MNNKSDDDKVMQAAVQVAKAVYEAIKEFGPDGVPSGHLYAAVSSVFSSLETYESMIDMLVRSRMVRRTSNHCLVAVTGEG